MSQLCQLANTVAPPEAERYTEIVESSKIAIIDDEPTNIKIVQLYLEKEGYRNFICTTDATQALDMIRNDQPDIVLLDVMMPQISGLEILAAMCGEQHLKRTPVIVLTAATEAKVKLQALQLGASDVLAKPVDPSELLLRVRNVLSVKVYQDSLADLVEAQSELLDRTFTGAVCMLTEIIESIESPAVDSSQVRSVAEKLMSSLDVESNWTLPVASRLLVVGLPLLTRSQRDVLTSEPVASTTHRQIVRQMIEISSNLIRRIPRLDPVIDVLDDALHVDGSLSPTDSKSRTFATFLLTGFYVDLLRRCGARGDAIVTEMQKRFPSIDRNIVASTQSLLGIASNTQSDGTLEIETLEPSRLTVGMIVAAKVTDNKQRLLVAKGRPLTQPMIVRLRQMAESQDITVRVFVSDNNRCVSV